jgi:hypothetical protein
VIIGRRLAGFSHIGLSRQVHQCFVPARGGRASPSTASTGRPASVATVASLLSATPTAASAYGRCQRTCLVLSSHLCPNRADAPCGRYRQSCG